MENFNEVYSSNHKKVLNYVNRKITDDLTVAEELTNDIFMKVYKSFDTYDSNLASMSTWVMNIANNAVIDHYRKKTNDTVSLDATIGEDGKISLMDKIPSPTNPHKKMVSDETLEIIQGEFDALPEKYREIAKLYFNNQLTYDEIVAKLNIPLGTVKGQINRARIKLVKRLERVRLLRRSIGTTQCQRCIERLVIHGLRSPVAA